MDKGRIFFTGKPSCFLRFIDGFAEEKCASDSGAGDRCETR